MRRVAVLAVTCCLLGLITTPPCAAEELQAICVPWQPANPSIAHYTYDGASTTLKGIARGVSSGEYRWDFGDGDGTGWIAITDPYNLGATHVYSGIAGQLFIATLYVQEEASEAQDTYPIRIYESSDLGIPSHLDVRINMAVDEGLWWLHTNMLRATFPGGDPGYEQPYGSWDPSYYPLGATAVSVDAFQLHGSKANLDYDSDPYVETVQRGLNYLLFNTYSYAIGAQEHGDPDTNGNGFGLVCNSSSSLYDSRQTYLGGICMVTLASSGASSRVATVGGADVQGRTYGEIVQDMVDFFAWGQVDGGSGRGGWRYHANFSNSDMSTAQWPPLGMLAAEQNMGSEVPQFVRDELLIFLQYTQSIALDNDNGVFYYSGPGQMPNITKTAAGIICHEFLGTPLTDPAIESAIGFIYRHWNDTGTGWDYTRLHGNSYGMYGLMKALRIPEPDIARVTEYDYNSGTTTANYFDWYYTPVGQAQLGLASYTVADQHTDGSWDDSVGPNSVSDAFATGWRILVLLKGVTIIPPEAVVCDCDEQEYNLNQDIHLDGSCSYHPDLKRSIASYEWDFEYDGDFVTDAVGVTASIAGGYPDTGIHPTALRVADDNPVYLGGPQTDVFVCDVSVHPPPHCPHAFAGGPYIGWIGEAVTFDASASWDPDNEIVNYEWDLDNDGEFDDAVGVTVEWTWVQPYTGVVGLRVTDAAGESDACSDADYTTVDIGNHAPTSDPNGPYFAGPGTTITLDGSGSYDPDVDDPITFAWDLDDDGQFDDSDLATPDLTVGPDIGTVYDVCLTVTDSFGEYDIECTTVEVVPNLPPDCSAAEASPTGLWPPHNNMVSVDILGVVDPDGDPVTIAISGITSDEATATELGAAGPRHAPDAEGTGTEAALLRAERSGLGNGRVYAISFVASDPAGATCSADVAVCVPHDREPGTCIDDGQTYDATQVN